VEKMVNIHKGTDFQNISTSEVFEEATEQVTSPVKQQMIDWIFEAIEELKKKKDKIVSSFKVTGFLNVRNGRENQE
jgi:hypothetical protein